MKKVEDQIKYVLEKAQDIRLTDESQYGEEASISYQAWCALAQHVLETVNPKGTFLRAFNGAPSPVAFTQSGPAPRILLGFRRRVAILQGLLEAVERGLLIPIKEMMISDVYADGIEIATDLLEKGHLHASGTVAGIVLETRLRDLVKELELYEPKDTIAKLSQKLRQRDRIDAMEITWITNMGQLRNKAAHGDETLTHDDVERLLQDVPRLLAGSLRLTG